MLGARSSVGPYVGVAVLCNRIERQPEGTSDLIGIVDGVNLDSPFVDSAQGITLRLQAVVFLRAGDLRGDYLLAVRGRYPSGTDGPMLSRLVVFTDDAPTAMVVVPIEIEVQHVGTYWFDVFFEQKTLTRIPFTARRGDPGDVRAREIREALKAQDEDDV